MTPGATVIDAEGLTRRFGDHIAVDGLSLGVQKGEIFGLVGPDGAGKTTTLRMLCGILDPSAGRARVAGYDASLQAGRVKEHLAYMSQRFGLYPDLTVQENVSFYADLYGVTRRGRRQRIDALLDFSYMKPFKHRLAAQLSGGMQQKLQLVCALIHTPEVLLLDEPTNGVDPVSRRDFWGILYRLLKDGVTILVTTAYLDEAERCSRVGLLSEGRLIAQGRPDEVRRMMQGKILSVSTPETRRASCLLRRSLEEVRDVTTFGDSIHVVCEDPRVTGAAAREILVRAGQDVEDLREVSPTLEDVFISMLGQRAASLRQDPTAMGAVAGTEAADTEGQNSVEVRELSRRFGDFTAVDRISFRVSPGEIFGFLGPNGAGKSTTIRMLCGLLAPSAGSGSVAGWDIMTQPEQIKASIGYMSQKFSLYEDLRVSENIDFYGGIYGLAGRRLAERKAWAIHMAGLEGRENDPTQRLSGGWKQRLALACAILHEPPIVFLDEPTSGVDPLSRRRFWDLIHTMADGGVTVFVTTHYMEEAEYCDRVALIYRGRIIALDTPHRLKTSLSDEAILDVRCDQPQAVIEPVENLTAVAEAALFGAGLHVKTTDPEAAERQIEVLLQNQMGSGFKIERILPVMEDVFVALIEREERKENFRK